MTGVLVLLWCPGSSPGWRGGEGGGGVTAADLRFTIYAESEQQECEGALTALGCDMTCMNYLRQYVAERLSHATAVACHYSHCYSFELNIIIICRV